MSPVTTVGQVFEAIQQAKAGAPDFCTNFFPVERKLQDWIERAELSAEFRTGAAFFLRRDRDFQHLYYCASSMTALKRELSSLKEIRSGKIVLDILGKESSLSDMLAVWEVMGFRRYTRLFRMARMTSAAGETALNSDDTLALATPADARSVLNLIEQEFNRYGEQLPLLYEIEAAIAAGQIIVARRDAEIAGLLFFETQGVTSTLRFWAVDGRFRSLKLGSGLMRRYFATQNAVRRFVLWVAADNLNAVQKYRHYGYAPDGLVDHVLANEFIRS